MTKRTLFGFILFGSALAAICAGGIFVALVLGGACYVGGTEFIAMARAKGYKPSPRIVLGMIIAFFILSALPAILPSRSLSWNFPIEHYPMLLMIGLSFCFVRLLFRREEQPPATIADIATTILGFIYVGFLPSHLVLLRNLNPPNLTTSANPLLQPGLAYVWTSLFCVWATDVYAYVCGRRFGRRLLYPQVSPKKTVEGAVAGLLGSIVWACILVYLFDTYFPGHPFQGRFWQAPFMGAAISVACQIGDLCESLLKRDAGMKDSSALIPGHGGMLDRGDSLLFASPIAYYWVCLVVLGIL